MENDLFFEKKNLQPAIKLIFSVLLFREKPAKRELFFFHNTGVKSG
jgi:hypothetical protein